MSDCKCVYCQQTESEIQLHFSEKEFVSLYEEGYVCSMCAVELKDECAYNDHINHELYNF
jgi:hypothetical protein